MNFKNIVNARLITYFIAWAAYLALRILSIVPIIEPKIYPDSGTYLSIASQPLFSSAFWGAGTPIITPLAYKLLGGNTDWIVIFQSVFSILAWTILAAIVARSIRIAWLKRIAFCTILIFSLSGEIMLWDWVVLSESISVSLMVLFMAGWFWLIEGGNWDWTRAAIVMAVGGLWMLTRDTNALLVIGVAFMLLALVMFKMADKRFVFVTIFFTLLFIPGFSSADSGGRWISPNLNIISRRILTNPEYVAFYRDQGMPVTPELLALAGAKARPVDEGFNDDPALDEFHQWHRENGKSVYLKFLLSTPIDTLRSPIQNISTMVYTEPLFLYAPRGFEAVFPFPFDQIIFFKTWKPVIAWILAILAIAGFVLAFWKKDRKWVVPLSMFILLYPHLLTVWHIANPEALEFRHAYHFNVHLRVFIWMALLFTADDLSIYVIPRYRSFFIRVRFGFIGVGLIIIIASLIIDFVIPGQDRFSIGYAQGAGLMVGLLSVYIGLRLHKSNLEIL